MSNKLDLDYQMLLKDILENGIEKEDRTGTGTLSVFGRQIRHNMKDGFPLLTTKKMAVNSMMTELKWFLRGDTNIKYLVDRGCNIWNGDAYKQYATYARGLEEPDYSVHIDDPVQNKVRILTQAEFIERIKTDDEFAGEWGELGPIYGAQWRKWDGIDQIQEIIDTLKTNPDSRRMLVSAWNVNYLDEMTLPPCHYGFQVYTRELSLAERRDWCKTHNIVLEHLEAGLENEEDDMRANRVPTRTISLMWNQRSVDTFLGLPFNIASYGLLLEIIAKEVNMIPDELIGNLGDVHLYSNHVEQARKQIMREPYNLPVITKLDSNLLEGEFDCDISYYECWPAIKAPLSN